MSSKEVRRSCSVKRDKDDERSFKIDITFDFEGTEEDQVIEWAVSHLVINAQRVLRTKSEDELVTLEKAGYNVKASEAGRGSRRDPLGAYKRKFAGLSKDDKLAQLAELEAMIEDEEDVTDSDEE